MSSFKESVQRRKAAKTVLSCHKNTVEKRRNRQIAKDITRSGAKMCRDADIRAYALVGIDANGRSHCEWDTGSILPLWSFPSTIERMLARDIEESGIEETWKPPLLPIKG